MRRVIGFAGGLLLLSLAAPAIAQTYGPPAPAPRAQETLRVAAPVAPVERRTANVRRPFIGAESPTGDMRLGVGLFRVQKTDDNDPNRNFPMRDPSGRTQKVAAVGASLRF
jgi:hypothetical protein